MQCFVNEKAPKHIAPGPSVFRVKRTAPCYLVMPTPPARTPCAAVMTIDGEKEQGMNTVDLGP